MDSCLSLTCSFTRLGDCSESHLAVEIQTMDQFGSNEGGIGSLIEDSVTFDIIISVKAGTDDEVVVPLTLIQTLVAVRDGIWWKMRIGTCEIKFQHEIDP